MPQDLGFSHYLQVPRGIDVEHLQASLFEIPLPFPEASRTMFIRTGL